MIYVALLRGINVGGNRMVDMKTLKSVFEAAGMTDVRTYINSGNVVFSTKLRSRARICDVLQKAIAKRFGFEVDVLVRSAADMERIAGAIPAAWINDAAWKCDVFFLWDDPDRGSVFDELEENPGVETVIYAPGAVIWGIDRKRVAESRVAKLVGTKLHKQMTVRNCNTVRKLLELTRD